MDQPCRATCRPRYSFYAQGRSNPPARTALGLFFLFRVFTASPRPPLLKTLRPWALARRSRRLCIADRSSASRSSRLPFGVLTSSERLAAAVVFPSAEAFPYEVFAPAAKRPPARAGALGSLRIFFKDAAQASLVGGGAYSGNEPLSNSYN